MDKKKNYVTAVGGVLIGLLLSGGPVLALDKDDLLNRVFSSKMATVEQKVKTPDLASTKSCPYKVERQKAFKSALDKLVMDRVLTQDQSDKVLKRFEMARSERKALWEKTKGMTQEQRSQFIKDNRGKFRNPIRQLVSDGIINEEQARTIRETMHKGYKTKNR